MESIMIREEYRPEEKAKIVEEVLLDLPDWFGLPESTKAYIEEAKSLPLWVAKKGEKTLGFVTLKETSEDAAELHCMGIKKEFHRQGIGEGLFGELEQYAAKHYSYLQVKTVDEGHYPQYDHTISFYKKMGFKKLEVFPDLWDPWNPCLILVKSCS